MGSRTRNGLILVAILQFVPVLFFPFEWLALLGPLAWIVTTAIFAGLGIGLVRRRAWARIATIFVQGFSIIVRLLVTIGNAIQGGELGNPVNVSLISTSIISMLLSGVILYYMDLPDIEMQMQ